MKDFFRLRVLLPFVFGVIFLVAPAFANHSWNGYHWARTANPFTLKLGDNVSSVWDGFLGTASADWNVSSVLDAAVVSGGTNAKRCKATNGRVEVCNSKYGRNGWIGLAQIWIVGDHIYQGVVKMNDTYFSMVQYNKPEWRAMVMCQEIGHTLGLDHQDELFDNPNLGTCMDYTGNPLGPPTNEHPNTHDYEELEAIYAHLDSTTTVDQSASAQGSLAADENLDEPGSWGKKVKGKGHVALFEKDLGKGHKLFTFVIYAE